MVERISSGARAGPRTDALGSNALGSDALGGAGRDVGKSGAGRGVGKSGVGKSSAGKSGLFSKRLAQKENVAQTRQTRATAGKAANKTAVRSKISTRANSRGTLPPARPRAPTSESREARRARLQETGKNLAQHKRDVADARDSHQRDVIQRFERDSARVLSSETTGGRDLTGKDTTGKDVAEVKWGTLDKHGMTNKLRQLDEIKGHESRGRDYKILQPPELLKRKAVLREGHQGLAGRLGSKIKDVLMRIFRPRQWQVRQTELAQARKDEFRAAELFSNRLMEYARSKQQATASESALVEERRALNLHNVPDASVEVAEVKPHIGAPSAYVVAYDKEIQQDPRYQAEKAILDKGIDGLRKEMEDEAKRHINEVLARQQAQGKAQREARERGEAVTSGSVTSGSVTSAPARQEVKGREIRGDGRTDEVDLARRASVKNPNATSL